MTKTMTVEQMLQNKEVKRFINKTDIVRAMVVDNLDGYNTFIVITQPDISKELFCINRIFGDFSLLVSVDNPAATATDVINYLAQKIEDKAKS